MAETLIPHKALQAQHFINWVNYFTQDEAKRCRILLAEILLRMEERKEEKK